MASTSSSVAKPAFGETADIPNILTALDQGTVLIRFFKKRGNRPEKRIFCLKTDTFEILQFPMTRGVLSVSEEKIDIREIRMVREGTDSKDFEKQQVGLRMIDNFCFIVYYGNEFRLKTLSVAALSREESDAWVKALRHVTHPNNFSSGLITHRWLNREFKMLDTNSTGGITSSDLRKFLAKINNKNLLNRARAIFTDFDYSRSGFLSIEDFFRMYDSLVYVKSIGEKFFPYCMDKQNLTFKELQAFLREAQKDTRGDDPAFVANLFKDFVKPPRFKDPRQPSLTLPEFINFLFSKKNSLFMDKCATVYQDMDRPLNHYWIASSHNTYLTGNQYSSESSVEAYAKVLLTGCRCIELDCWDGSDNQPIIYHGHTLTSKIRFIDVIKTIKEHAFTASDYPLILSIEQHCDIPQQQVMAQQFVEVFGDLLLTKSIDPNLTILPTPNQLKRKIIIKHKKLTPTEDGQIILEGPPTPTANIPEPTDSNELASFILDISESVKNGYLLMQDPIVKIWARHYFVLTNEKLFFTEQQEKEEEPEKEDETEVPSTELHLKEKWFHGKLASGRPDAERLLADYQSVNGSFLVRESATFTGDYSLSFARDQKYNHCRIHTKAEGGRTKYYLIENVCFDSIFDLIEHYRSNPLKSPLFEQILSHPVPQQNSHLGKPWFHESLSRHNAEDMLKRVRMDGAFLIRPSSEMNKQVAKGGSSQMTYSISFRAEGKVRHCRIVVENGNYMIGSAQFDSLTELVQYYETNPLYRRMKLKYAINDEVLKSIGDDPDEGSIYYHPVYCSLQDENQQKPCTVRALYDYTQRRPDELTFCREAIITNVVKHEGGWWKGDYGRKKGKWFPANYVQELEDGDPSTEDRALGSLQQGAIDIAGCQLEAHKNPASNTYILRIHPVPEPGGTSRPLEVASEKLDEIIEWQQMIEEVKSKLQNQAQATLKQQQVLNQQARQKKIALEMSDLVFYCRPVPFNLENIGAGQSKFYEMSSFVETRLDRIAKSKAQAGLFVSYSNRQLSRTYPKGQRLESSNLDPLPMWNAGCQMVALNYQTGDKQMHLNHGRFQQNGGSGFVLMPDCMFEPGFNPVDTTTHTKATPITLTIQIIGGRHLIRPGRGICSPLIEVEVCGIDADWAKFRTSTCKENGFIPVWNEGCEFDIVNPDLALIRFCAQDEDVFGDPNFIGQAVFPVSCLKTGFSSVPLKNAFNEELEKSALVVHVEIRKTYEEDEEIYSRMRTIKGRIQDLSQQINTLAHTNKGDKGGSSSTQSTMDQLQETMQHEAEQLYKLNKSKGKKRPPQ
ncbi:1-phosphatidylinositol 4,5-bisphosphate phosphodiesterase gamma-1-like [Halichondria panicea]|uniref:1-phosphatidylinositol 4,5-bisphosphate phosphodiesterase gamma-1-like n=1 Tax=Halichondria panicea TaxID=6063 RepID=UPI00312BCAA5